MNTLGVSLYLQFFFLFIYLFFFLAYSNFFLVILSVHFVS